MVDKILELFKDIWTAPAGKQVVGLLMAIPIGMGFFYHYYYSDIILENKELKSELKEERTNHGQTRDLYLSAEKRCAIEKLRIDSIHINRFNAYRDKIEAQNAETSNEWKRAYNEAINNLVKTKRVHEKTTREITNSND